MNRFFFHFFANQQIFHGMIFISFYDIVLQNLCTVVCKLFLDHILALAGLENAKYLSRQSFFGRRVKYYDGLM